MAHTTSLTQANDDDEIIELTDIVEKGTVPGVPGREFAPDSHEALESEMADLLSNESSEVDNLDELDLDALLGSSSPEGDFAKDPLADLEADPSGVAGAAKAVQPASDDIDFDSLLQEMVESKAQGVHETADAAGSADAAVVPDAAFKAHKAEASAEDADFMGDLEDVDNLLRDLVPPSQPADSTSGANIGADAEVETDDLASLLAGLDKKSSSQQSPDEVDDLDALLNSIMNPNETDNLETPVAPQVEEKAPVGFEDLDALLNAALQPEPVAESVAAPVAAPVVDMEPENLGEEPLNMAGSMAERADSSDADDEDADLDALLAQSDIDFSSSDFFTASDDLPESSTDSASPAAARAVEPALESATAGSPSAANDDFMDLDALLHEVTATAGLGSLGGSGGSGASGVSGGAVAKTSARADGDEFDLDALLNSMQNASATEPVQLPPHGTADELLDAEHAPESADSADDDLPDDFAAELDSIFAPQSAETPADSDTIAETVAAADSMDDFDLDAFLADLDTDQNDESAESASDNEADMTAEALSAAQEAEHNHQVQELALAALTEELGDDDAPFSLEMEAMPAQSQNAHDVEVDESRNNEQFVSGVFFEEPDGSKAESESDSEPTDDFSDISFDEFPLDNDLGDPLLIGDTSPQAELGAAVLEGLEQLAADIAAIQTKMASLAPAESQQAVLQTLSGNFAQLQEDVQQLSERQALSLAAVEARISDMEAQLAEKFAVNDSSDNAAAEQLALMAARLETLETAVSQPVVFDDSETLRKVDHLAGIMVALENRLQSLEVSQADKADMTDDVARLVDRVEALELHRHSSPEASTDTTAVSALEERVTALESNSEKAAAEAAARVIREEIAGLLAELGDSAS